MRSEDFGDFLARQRRPLLRVALRVLGRARSQDAEDVAQEILLRAWRRRSRLNFWNTDVPWTPNDVHWWLVQCARNEALNRKRGRKVDQRIVYRSNRFFEFLSDPKLDPRTKEATHAYYGDFIATLTEKELEVVEFRMVGMRVKHIASTLSLPAGTVSVRLQAVRAKLRKWLGPRLRVRPTTSDPGHLAPA